MKRNEMSFARWLELESILLGEANQTQTKALRSLFYIVFSYSMCAPPIWNQKEAKKEEKV